jgi:hypothetical protein
MRASKIAACAALALLLGIAAVHAADYSECEGVWGHTTQPPQQPPVASMPQCGALDAALARFGRRSSQWPHA